MTFLVPILIPGTFLIFFVAERLWPNRTLPKIRGWWLVGLIGFAVSGVLITGTAAAMSSALRGHALGDLGVLGTVAGGLVFFLAVDFVGYWLHRARHRWTALWRIFHQMHHAPERIDAAAGFFAHPLEFVLLGVVNGGVGALLGITPAAAAFGTLISFTMNVFVHSNLRTPRWLGLVIARPEMHALHHESGVHAFNYAFCALWDRAFGTHRNPETFRGENGLGHGAWRRIGTLLIGGDVTRARSPAVAPDVVLDRVAWTEPAL